MVVKIRPARVEDADAVGEVHVRAWQSAYRGMMPDDYLDGLHAEDHATRWREHLIAPMSQAELLVVVDDHRVVGFASVGPHLTATRPSTSVSSTRSTSSLTSGVEGSGGRC
jgi:hypothetical protein